MLPTLSLNHVHVTLACVCVCGSVPKPNKLPNYGLLRQQKRDSK